MGQTDFRQFDKYTEKAVSDLMSLGSDPAMAGFVAVIAMFPMINLANFLTLLEKLADRSVVRELADEIETYLASEQINMTKKVAAEIGPTVAEGCELALEVYRAFLRDLKQRQGPE